MDDATLKRFAEGGMGAQKAVDAAIEQAGNTAPAGARTMTAEEGERMVEDAVIAILQVVFTGIEASMAYVPPEIITKIIARVTGKLLSAGTCVGPIQNVLIHRSRLMEEFKAELRSIAPKMPPARGAKP